MQKISFSDLSPYPHKQNLYFYFYLLLRSIILQAILVFSFSFIKMPNKRNRRVVGADFAIVYALYVIAHDITWMYNFRKHSN